MKQVRNTVARWVAKVVSSAKAPAQITTTVRPLNKEQFGQVVGGVGDVQSPKGNW
jgi:hypothetical protein